MDRRKFLKSSALAAGYAAAAAKTAQAAPTEDQARRTGDGVTWNKAPCRFCGTGCHVQVGVKSGEVVAIAGDRHADVNKGLLCVKGSSSTPLASPSTAAASGRFPRATPPRSS